MPILSRLTRHWPVAALGVLAIAAFVIFHSKAAPSMAGWQHHWLKTTPFQIPRRALAAAVASPPSSGPTAPAYLYVLGGVDDTGRYIRDVEFSTLGTDGTPGPWRFTAPLREDRFYLSAVALNGYLYAIGGGQGSLGSDNLPVASVERAAIGLDGSLGAWEHAGHMTTPRRGPVAVTRQGSIYAIGGYNGTFLKTTERADLQPDGTLTEWRLDPVASHVDRYIHAATIWNNIIYLLGGHVQRGPHVSYGDVESSQLRDDGTLHAWQVEMTSLSTPRFIGSAFALNGFVYMLGGHDGAHRLRSVEYAPLDAAGHVGRWRFTADLAEPRSATALAVHRDTVYVLGGMGDSSALNTVEMARQTRDGRLGFAPAQ